MSGRLQAAAAAAEEDEDGEGETRSEEKVQRVRSCGGGSPPSAVPLVGVAGQDSQSLLSASPQRSLACL